MSKQSFSLCTFALFALMLNTNGQLPELGTACRNLSVVSPFIPSKYMGKWYEINRYENPNEKNGDCVTAEYSLESSGTITVANYVKYVENKTSSTIYGKAKMTNPTEGKLNVLFDNSSGFFSPYWVLGTDYENFAIVWSCRVDPLNNTHVFEYLWTLSREKTMSPTVELAVMSFIDQYFKQFSLRSTRHDDKFCNGASISHIPSLILIIPTFITSMLYFFINRL